LINEETLLEIQKEAQVAQGRYGDFTSTHEALGVLTEEMRELEDAIRLNAMGSVAMEAVQVSAVAARLFVLAERALAGDAPAFLKRSGCTGWEIPR
jgi:hypothetical protein